jgi:hypothetical protein
VRGRRLCFLTFLDAPWPLPSAKRVSVAQSFQANRSRLPRSRDPSEFHRSIVRIGHEHVIRNQGNHMNLMYQDSQGDSQAFAGY